MQFTGWTPEDCSVFEVDDFQARMELIKTEIRPKLKMLADDLMVYLGRSPLEWHPHVASHMRRRTNPPDETWVAFGRSKRGYKMFSHLMTGICQEGAFARLVVKADGEDIENLKACSTKPEIIHEAVGIARDEAGHSINKIERFDGSGWVSLSDSDILNDWLLGERDFVLGRAFTVEESAEGEILVRKIADTFEALMAFYQIGAGYRKLPEASLK